MSVQSRQRATHLTLRITASLAWIAAVCMPFLGLIAGPEGLFVGILAIVPMIAIAAGIDWMINVYDVLADIRDQGEAASPVEPLERE